MLVRKEASGLEIIVAGVKMKKPEDPREQILEVFSDGQANACNCRASLLSEAHLCTIGRDPGPGNRSILARPTVQFPGKTDTPVTHKDDSTSFTGLVGAIVFAFQLRNSSRGVLPEGEQSASSRDGVEQF